MEQQVEMETDDKVELTADEQAFYSHVATTASTTASSTGQSVNRGKGYKSTVKAFGRFLEWAQGQTGFSLPRILKDVTEAQWLSGSTYLQFLKWLEEKATWGAAKKCYAPRTCGEYFRNILNAAHKSLVASYKAKGWAFPERAERFFSVLDSSKNTWLSIAEFNLERRANQEAIEGGKEPTGVDGDDNALLEKADLRLIVLMYHREGSQESLLRAALVLDEYQTVSRSGEPIASPWFLFSWSRSLKAVVFKRYQVKTAKLKSCVWMNAAPTPEAGAQLDIVLAQAQLASTGYFNTLCEVKNEVVYPSRFLRSDSANSSFMTAIVYVSVRACTALNSFGQG
jgi:hypothetical protein